MKVSKIIKRLKKAQEADEELYSMLNEELHDRTAGLVYGQLWDAYLSLAVGDDWDFYAEQVGNQRSESGEFITDDIMRALCYDFDAKAVESLVDEGWGVIFERSMLEPELEALNE